MTITDIFKLRPHIVKIRDLRCGQGEWEETLNNTTAAMLMSNSFKFTRSSSNRKLPLV